MEPQAVSALSCDLKVMWAALTAAANSSTPTGKHTHTCVNFNWLAWLECVGTIFFILTLKGKVYLIFGVAQKCKKSLVQC